ncbi:Aste57867_23739 [Aphanomyces stellatus]|uniref:Aste57867_23739 protein n=1 Tax=Aphanomyces stellatus TaxID=120398 RepID=A0A485LNK7_9STRA|nr:hypothetical protein As57867_023667 [Aphanomyces stellatus]VFU00384.1 Aste57867_23739 [Aphanomyces stellatus]
MEADGGGTIDESTWDVYQDLHFLFANDVELNNELAYVCDLLSEPASDDGASGMDETGVAATPTPPSQGTATGAAGKRKAKRPKEVTGPSINPSRIRQQQQIKCLRDQVDELKAQLFEAERNAAMRFDVSVWKRVARQELFERSKAIHENEQLRAEVQHQATFIDEMEKVLRKKPRLSLETDVQSEAWQACRLAAQASLRVAAIHAIADRQFRRMQSAFVAANIFDCTDDIIRATPKPQPNNSVILEYVYHVTLAAPCHLVGPAVWNVWNGTRGPPLPDGAVQTNEYIDPTTLYQAFRRSNDKHETVHSNIVWKYYIEPRRQAIVWRAVLDDALVPHMADGAIHDEWGWAAVVPHPSDPSACRLTLLLNIVTEPIQDESRGSEDALIEESLEQIKKLSFVEPPEAPGTFPGAPATDATITEELPFDKRTFMERGKQMELALKRAIDDVIDDFRRSSSQGTE